MLDDGPARGDDSRNLKLLVVVGRRRLGHIRDFRWCGLRVSVDVQATVLVPVFVRVLCGLGVSWFKLLCLTLLVPVFVRVFTKLQVVRSHGHVGSKSILRFDRDLSRYLGLDSTHMPGNIPATLSTMKKLE